jgi:dTDP-6-deoxy-L-talose 4-dehydrogenase (NAD+)
MSKGEQERDYLPVEKIAEVITKLALINEGNGVVNCCSGKPITIMKLVEDHIAKRNATMELNPGYYPYPDYEPFQFWGSTKKLEQILKV